MAEPGSGQDMKMKRKNRCPTFWQAPNTSQEMEWPWQNSNQSLAAASCDFPFARLHHLISQAREDAAYSCVENPGRPGCLSRAAGWGREGGVGGGGGGSPSATNLYRLSVIWRDSSSGHCPRSAALLSMGSMTSRDTAPSMSSGAVPQSPNITCVSWW